MRPRRRTASRPSARQQPYQPDMQEVKDLRGGEIFLEIESAPLRLLVVKEMAQRAKIVGLELWREQAG